MGAGEKLIWQPPSFEICELFITYSICLHNSMVINVQDSLFNLHPFVCYPEKNIGWHTIYISRVGSLKKWGSLYL